MTSKADPLMYPHEFLSFYDSWFTLPSTKAGHSSKPQTRVFILICCEISPASVYPANLVDEIGAKEHG
jgi:hypothetical protein